MCRARKSLWMVMAAILLTSLAVSPVSIKGRAGETTAATFPILGPYLNIWTDAVENINQDVVYNSVHDEYLVIWSIKQDDYSTDLWARRVGSDGTLYPYFCIATMPGKILGSAHAAYSSEQDRYFVVFTYPRDDDLNNTEISAVTFDSEGGNLSGFLEVDPLESKYYSPAVAYNEQDDEFLVAYENVTPTCIDILARRFTAQTGLPADAPHTIRSCTADDSNRGPDIAYNPIRNNYLVSYIHFQYGQPTYQSYMNAKVATSTLDALSPEFQLSGDGISSAYGHVVAGRDEYLAIWTANDGKIHAQRVNYDGTLPVPGSGFLITPTSTDNILTAISATNQGYWITWSHDPDPGQYAYDIYGNYISMGADEALPQEFPVDVDVNMQNYPKIACRWQGGCLVTDSYNLEVYPAGDSDIRGRFILLPRIYLPLVRR